MQLQQTQGYLTERDIQFREMKFKFEDERKEFQREREKHKNRIHELEEQNARLRLDAHHGGGDNTLVLSHAEKQELERQFEKKIAEISAKTKLCDALQLQIQQLERDREIRTATQQPAPGSPATPSQQTPSLASLFPLTPTPASLEIGEAQVVALFTTLRERIRVVSMTRFSDSTSLDQIPEGSRQELNQLSGNWKSYFANTNTNADGAANKAAPGTPANNNAGNNDKDNAGAGPQMGGYLMRALIWRYVHSALFMKPGRVWGQETRSALRVLGAMLSPPGLPESEYQAWRMGTGMLLHRASRGTADPGVLDVVAKQVLEATRHFSARSGGESAQQQQLGKDLHEIVGIAAELAAILARSRYETLMADKPDSPLTRGFAFHEQTMVVKSHMGAGAPSTPSTPGTRPIVDMMITPCLLRKGDFGEYAVVVKAEVVC